MILISILFSVTEENTAAKGVDTPMLESATFLVTTFFISTLYALTFWVFA